MIYTTGAIPKGWKLTVAPAPGDKYWCERRGVWIPVIPGCPAPAGTVVITKEGR